MVSNHVAQYPHVGYRSNTTTKMKTRTATFTEIEYHELDDMITKFLNEKGIKWKFPDQSKFECAAEEEWGNDESHATTVDGKVDKYDKEQILKGELGYKTYAILDWMAAEGAIPKGEYRINVCW